ncbi:snoRNA-binding rRNA-processing protein [Tieghemiomyces parasiticus]|uniref:SnoRNA-binding rRNA-processing protein n=1 Tax=Tieghemiomyces parasiticus TaxID=78921 RepID=A0A9W8DHK6_9FUNG|nr:snoRNA-binding rRNA-processing protein [Tieghemiomyces parasiticus]
MGKAKSSKRERERHDPLLADVGDKDIEFMKSRAKFALREEVREANSAEEFVSANLSKKILRLAKEQQREDEVMTATSVTETRATAAGRPTAFDAMDDDVDSEEEDEDDSSSEIGDYAGDYEALDIDEADQEAMARFLPETPQAQQSLADMIMGKIDHQNAERARAQALAGIPPGPRVNPKVQEVYGKIGLILSRYKSGPLPKAFKIIPTIPAWEEIVMLTEPENWTPHATFEAVKLFIHGTAVKGVARMFEYVVLEKVRENIRRTKKLHHHLYLALKKAIYRPEAFFKGFIFPLCKSGSCTLREAVIIGSVMAKVKIPPLHASSALLKLAQLEHYNGPTSLFIRVLLDKKYALPYKVIDGLVFHFLSFKTEERQLPVLWHQALLTLAQRYKADVTPDQKDALLDLLKYQFHEGISPEVRRELMNSTCRSELLPGAMDVS